MSSLLQQRRGFNLVLAAVIVAAMAAAPASRPVTALPTAPSNPVEVSTEIGSTAGRTGKVTVTLKAIVTKKSVTYTIELARHGDFDYSSFEVSPDDLASVIQALSDCVAKPDADFEKEAGEITVASKEDDGKRYVLIVQKQERISLHDKYVNIDIDNAATLLSFLKKSLTVMEWMKDRMAAIQK